MMALWIAVAAVLAYAYGSLHIVKQYERAVSFFLGRYWATKGPGLIFVPAFFAKLQRVSLRIIAMDIPPQDVITRDNVSVKV
ncbi:MAG: slipin family protein, partial [Gemmatimonadetes bacterium]|nr:slipin family protein [Gemmatimonadota bacterium]